MKVRLLKLQYFEIIGIITLILLLSVNAHLVMQAPTEDRDGKLKFGQTTCISSDGRRIAIGANGYEKFKGALYVYDHATGPGDKMEHWRRTKLCGNNTKSAEERKPRELRVIEKGSGFGFSCAFTSNSRHLIVGAPGHTLQRGAVFIYRHDEWTNSWKEVAKLEDPNGRTSDSFGWAVAVSDTCSAIAVSAKGRRANNGEVTLFSCKKKCSECIIVDRLSPPDYTDSVGPRGIRIRNNFGISIAMSATGNVVVVGCTGFEEERGAAYVFVSEKGKKEWKLMQRLESLNAQKYGFFGYKVSLTRNAQHLAIGADGEDNYRGTVYIFEHSIRHNKSNEYQHKHTVKAGERFEEDNFGGALSFSWDGKTLAVGAPGASRDSEKDIGALFLYEYVEDGSISSWELTDTIWPSSKQTNAGKFFAWSVAVSSYGRKFVASAPDSFDGTGAATIGLFELDAKRSTFAKHLSNDEGQRDRKEEL